MFNKRGYAVMKKVNLIILILTLITGCSSTPYQPLNERGSLWKSRGGYEEKVISKNIYEIGFIGNSFTTQASSMFSAIRRAADIAESNGKTHFVILEEQSFEKQRTESGYTGYNYYTRITTSPSSRIKIEFVNPPNNYSKDKQVYSVATIKAIAKKTGENNDLFPKIDNWRQYLKEYKQQDKKIFDIILYNAYFRNKDDYLYALGFATALLKERKDIARQWMEAPLLPIGQQFVATSLALSDNDDLKEKYIKKINFTKKHEQILKLLLLAKNNDALKKDFYLGSFAYNLDTTIILRQLEPTMKKLVAEYKKIHLVKSEAINNNIVNNTSSILQEINEYTKGYTTLNKEVANKIASLLTSHDIAALTSEVEQKNEDVYRYEKDGYNLLIGTYPITSKENSDNIPRNLLIARVGQDRIVNSIVELKNIPKLDLMLEIIDPLGYMRTLGSHRFRKPYFSGSKEISLSKDYKIKGKKIASPGIYQLRAHTSDKNGKTDVFFLYFLAI
jgi:hypothetical protein